MGIYLINKPFLPKSKWDPKTTKGGAYIEAQVEFGKMCDMVRTCNSGLSGQCCTYQATGGHGTTGAAAAGCNSILWNPGDGNEWIIWDSKQVLSTKLYKCYQPECSQLFPDLTFDSDGVVQNN